jgi:hypothetical protein
MLYVGCGNCRSIIPLYCAGQYMPHAATYVDAAAGGAYCPYCGPLAPVFTCMQCGVTQMMYVAGAGFSPQMMAPGGPRTIAPAVQAAQGTSGSQLTSLLLSAGKSFLTDFAKHAGGQFGDEFGKDASQWASNWFSGDPWSGDGSQSW